jgi:hypothetical protein
MYEPDMIGAIKIKDGLFIGDELASQVITLNKSQIIRIILYFSIHSFIIDFINILNSKI